MESIQEEVTNSEIEKVIPDAEEAIEEFDEVQENEDAL
jgi:hypothetical protein